MEILRPYVGRKCTAFQSLWLEGGKLLSVKHPPLPALIPSDTGAACLCWPECVCSGGRGCSVHMHFLSVNYGMMWALFPTKFFHMFGCLTSTH